jgi:F-type H+-transporting ATPase subunit delta
MAANDRKLLSQAILNMLEDGQSTASVAQETAKFLVSQGRTRELDALMRDVEQMRYQKDDIFEASAVSARSLSSEVEQQIKTLMGAKHVILDTSLDPEVVGGVRVRALDKQLDLSIESKLNTLRHADTKAA